MRRDAPLVSLLSSIPWLLDANTWSVARDARGGGPHGLGGFALGNGWIFAHAGLVPPASRLTGITGPTYQTHDPNDPAGAFGDCWLELRSPRAPSLGRERLWRPRKSGVLVTQAADRGVALVTIDFAPPQRPLLVRIVELWGADALGDEAELVIHFPAGQPVDARRRSLCARGGPGRVLILGPVVAGRQAEPGRIRILLRHVPREAGVVRFLILLAAGTSEDTARRAIYQATDAVALLEETQVHWHRWLERTYTPKLWPQNLPGRTATARTIADLIELAKLDLKMQQAGDTGAIAPLLYRKELKAREAAGAVRALLAIRAREDAQALLEYYYRASIVLGRIPPSVPLDLGVAGVGDPPNWAAVHVPPAEVPSWIVLQHRWWLEAGGDVGLVRRHWAFLRRCATGQASTGDGLLPFAGDEPYLHGALYRLFPARLGWPNDLIADDGARGYAAWSLDSLVLYAAAHRAMAWMSERIGQDDERAQYEREAARAGRLIEGRFWMPERGYYAPAIYPLTGARHEAPFSPINLRPLWVRYHGALDPRAGSNLEALIDTVGFRRTTPNCEFTVGDAAGYLLWDLVEMHSPLAPIALAHLVATAGPAGDWGELHGPDGLPYDDDASGIPHRLSPQVIGVNLDAIYHYYATRHARDEPETALRELTGPFRPFRYPPPPMPGRAVIVAADAQELFAARRTLGNSADEATVIEPGIPMEEDYFERLLFDVSGSRRVETLVLGASALRADRRSMKPGDFWRHPRIAAALARFEQEGGRLLRV